MYIATGFVTLVHSYIQVTARSIDYILETELVKVIQLKYPTISYTNKLYEGNKKTSNFTSQNAKIVLQNQKKKKKKKNCLRRATNLASLEKLLRSYFVTIIRTLQAREKSLGRL